MGKQPPNDPDPRWVTPPSNIPDDGSHTPGPWDLEVGTYFQSEARRILVTSANHGMLIANICHTELTDPRARATVDANALLVRAAPDLLAACEAATDALAAEFGEMGPPVVQEVLAQLREALAAAKEGEE